MLRKTLTILSLLGLLISIGLWGVSYLHIAYAPATMIHKFKLSHGKIWFVRLRNSVGDVHDVAKELLYDDPDLKPCREIAFREEEEGIVTFDILFFVPGFTLNDQGLTLSDTEMYGAKFARCTSTPMRLVVGTPLYLPALAFALGSIWAAWPTYRCRKRKRLGLCLKCGYDLRASRDRCPECGHAFSKVE